MQWRGLGVKTRGKGNGAITGRDRTLPVNMRFIGYLAPPVSSTNSACLGCSPIQFTLPDSRS